MLPLTQRKLLKWSKECDTVYDTLLGITPLQTYITKCKEVCSAANLNIDITVYYEVTHK